MTAVYGRLAPGRELGPADFADLTPVPVTAVEWVADGRLCVTFDGTLTDDEAAAARRRITSPDVDTETVRAQAVRAVVGNRAYLALAAPTAAETREQVAALTRQMNALIRLAAE